MLTKLEIAALMAGLYLWYTSRKAYGNRLLRPTQQDSGAKKQTRRKPPAGLPRGLGNNPNVTLDGKMAF